MEYDYLKQKRQDKFYGIIAGVSSLIACAIVILSFIVGISLFDRGGVEIISGILFGIASILAFTRRHYLSSYGASYGSICFNFLGFIYVLLLDVIGIIFAVIGIITYTISIVKGE